MTTPDTLTCAQVVALQHEVASREGEDDTTEACDYWLWCHDRGVSPPGLEPYTQIICDAINAYAVN